MSVYESIIAGLTEAIEDVRNEHKILKRHTIEMAKEADSVVLTGEAVLSFINPLFRPTREETERCNVVMKKRDREVIITEHEDGFSANVSWLDLSFLENEFASSNRDRVYYENKY